MVRTLPASQFREVMVMALALPAPSGSIMMGPALAWFTVPSTASAAAILIILFMEYLQLKQVMRNWSEA